MRNMLVAGNWKMHGTVAEVAERARGIAVATAACEAEVLLFPASIHLSLALEQVVGLGVGIGAQNCSEHQPGPWTGELAAAMLANLGCRWVLLGHSERRRHFGETDATVAAKARVARAAGLHPVLCLGETLEQRQQGQAQAAVQAQLAALVDEMQAGDVIAYEPVWAIGTGQTATPAQAQEMHRFIRGCLRQRAPDLARDTRLLYGGSVNAVNAAELFDQEDIDGGLVGGASLDVEEFIAIVKAARF